MLIKFFDKDWVVMAFVAITILFCGLFRCSDVVHARRPMLTQEEFSPETRLWLSRAMVSEAGWLAKRDHAAIAHILYRRWKNALRRWPDLTFEQVIRRYCSGFYVSTESLTKRQKWVQELVPAAIKPANWPETASWERHLPLWRAVWERAGRFGRGELQDPCKGAAWHWGAEFDVPQGRMERVDCGDTRNIFYGLSKGKNGPYAEIESRTVLAP